MTQQVNISQCARMYGKDRRWVYNRLKKHGISTQRGQGNTGRRLKLQEFIAHCGEPLHNKGAVEVSEFDDWRGFFTLNGSESGGCLSPSRYWGFPCQLSRYLSTLILAF